VSAGQLLTGRGSVSTTFTAHGSEATLAPVASLESGGEWFQVGDAEASEFVLALRSHAVLWPSSPSTLPANTGGWLGPRFLITYADRIDPERNAVIESFRVDYDGAVALAARVASEHVDLGGLFGSERPEGDEPTELARGGAADCAQAAAAWFCRQLFPS
jgi:hypothetical protein